MRSHLEIIIRSNSYHRPLNRLCSYYWIIRMQYTQRNLSFQLDNKYEKYKLELSFDCILRLPYMEENAYESDSTSGFRKIQRTESRSSGLKKLICTSYWPVAIMSKKVSMLWH